MDAGADHQHRNVAPGAHSGPLRPQIVVANSAMPLPYTLREVIAATGQRSSARARDADVQIHSRPMSSVVHPSTAPASSGFRSRGRSRPSAPRCSSATTSRPFALLGRWAGGGALIGSEPVEVASDDDDPFALLDDSAAAQDELRSGRRRLVRLARLRARAAPRADRREPAAGAPPATLPARLLRPSAAPGQRRTVVVRGALDPRTRRGAAHAPARARSARREPAAPAPVFSGAVASEAGRGGPRARRRRVPRADPRRRPVPGEHLRPPGVAPERRPARPVRARCAAPSTRSRGVHVRSVGRRREPLARAVPRAPRAARAERSDQGHAPAACGSRLGRRRAARGSSAPRRTGRRT